MSVWKRAAERLLVRASGEWALGRRRGRTLILAYHNIIPDGEAVPGETSLHLRRAAFSRQLDVLMESHEIVPLGVCLDSGGNRDRPRVVITFDDAYRGALTIGLSEIARRGLPATVFVAPGLLGGTRPWWDLLACHRDGKLEADVRDHAIEALRGDKATIIGSLLEGTQRGDGPPPKIEETAGAIATVDDLNRADRTPGITLGAHGWAHLNLARLATERLIYELEHPLEWLRSRFDSVVPWLSYPYGRNSRRVQEAADEVGYQGAVRVSGGWIPPKDEINAYSVPRTNIPAALSMDGFRLRISGVLTD